MPRTAIASLGNPLRRDDGIPEMIVRSLESEHFLDADYYYGNPLNYAGRLSEYDKVFLVDSVLSADPPGTVKILRLSEVTGPGLSTHSAPVTLLERLAGNAWLVGIVVRDTGYGTRVSEELEKEYPRILEEVKKAILSCS